jgi:hypothetical protein
MDLWLFSGHSHDCRHLQHALLAISSKRLALMAAAQFKHDQRVFQSRRRGELLPL